jgi:hypothetical protein
VTPPAADVPSTTTRASGSAPSTLSTGASAPVDVSLCAQAYTSAPGTAVGTATEPTSAVTTAGASRWGAAAAAVANFAENSPKLAWALRRRISEATATSQKVVDPPLPRTTS